MPIRQRCIPKNFSRKIPWYWFFGKKAHNNNNNNYVKLINFEKTILALVAIDTKAKPRSVII